MLRLVAASFLFSILPATAQYQHEVEAAAIKATADAQKKERVFKTIERLTISKIEKMGEVGEIRADLVPEFVTLAQKASMISSNQKDFIDRFNAMAESRSRVIGLISSPVAIPESLKEANPEEGLSYAGSFTSRRKIPESIVSMIEYDAHQKWPYRKDMERHVVISQSEAWCRYQNFAQNTDPVIQSLVKDAKEKWEYNFDMLVFHVETRYKEYKDEKEAEERRALRAGLPPAPVAQQYDPDLPPGVKRSN